MEIAHRCAEEDTPDHRQHGVAQIAVQGRHCALGDPAREAVAHHQVRALAQFSHEPIKPREVVAVIAVAHDDIATLGMLDPRDQGRAVALLRRMHDPRAQPLGNRLAAIGGAIVGNQHLAPDTAARKVSLGLDDAGFERLCLVQAWHQNGKFGHVRCP